MNSREEAEYRLELAKGFLERARRSLERGDLSECVSNSQLSVENAAKAVISCIRIPSWTHDPSEELRQIAELQEVRQMGREVQEELDRVAEAAHRLAPEHGRSSYGDRARRIPPWQLYSREDASEALRAAEFSCRAAKRFLHLWFTG